MANTTNSITHFVVIPVIANRSLRKILQNRSPTIHPPRITPRSTFIGALIVYRIINPTMDNSIVAAVEISAELTPNVRPNMTSAPTASTSVSAAGSAFKNTFVRKCPLIIFLFGSSARKNAGTPIVNILISEI